MQVDGPRADRAAAGQRDAGAALAGDEGAEHEHRGAHRLHEVVGRLDRGRGVAACSSTRAADPELDVGAERGRGPGPSCGCRAPRGRCAETTGSSVRSAAHRSGSEAFLAPEMRTRSLERPARRRRGSCPSRAAVYRLGTGTRVPQRAHRTDPRDRLAGRRRIRLDAREPRRRAESRGDRRRSMPCADLQDQSQPPGRSSAARGRGQAPVDGERLAGGEEGRPRARGRAPRGRARRARRAST